MQTKEKQKLVDDMNATVELEKEKINALNLIDLQNKENQHSKEKAEQKDLYLQQNVFLSKQLEHVLQMNQFSEEVQKSSGSISDLVQKIALEREGEVKRREDQLLQNESELNSK